MVEIDYKLHGTKILKLKNTGNWFIDLFMGKHVY